MAISIILHRNKSDPTVLNKDLEFVRSFTGTFREPFDVVSPVLLLEYDGAPDFNYVEIRSLKRFYFVNSYTNISTNLWSLDLYVDVLQSYQLSILRTEGLIERSASTYDPLIIDECAIYRQGFDTEIIEGSNTISEDLSGIPDAPRYLVVGNFLSLGSIFENQ